MYKARKCFWQCHVTYQLINEMEFTSASISPRRMISVIERRISIITAEMVLSFLFLTVYQFPDLPIVFCETWSHLALAFYHILMEIYPKRGFVRLFFIGREFSIFGYLHWYGFWWRHRYKSWFSNFKIKPWDGHLDFDNKKMH